MIPLSRHQNANGSANGSAARQSVKASEIDEREAGVVLTDLRLSPVAVDSGAVAILSDINRRDGLEGTLWSIPKTIADVFLSVKSDRWRGMRVSLRGQKYEYICTMYLVEPQDGFLNVPLLAICLQRGSSSENAILQIAAQCNLTPREEQVLKGISMGLTSKEVAQRMEISPNTVKTYLRLIMVKMGVTTRAAIVGRLLNRDNKTE